MKGFLRLLAVDFDEWNETTTNDYVTETGDTTCTAYTSCLDDTDTIFVWARIEHDFIIGDIKTRDEAIALGMVIPE